MKASLVSKRISAFLIDILFLFIVINLIMGIKFINPYYDKYVESYENYNEIVEKYNNKELTEDDFTKLYVQNYYQVTKYSISYNIIIVVCIILYFVLFQKFNNGQTLGKKLMRLKVVDSTEEKNVSILKYLIRSLSVYYIYIGGILPIIINCILIFILSPSSYMTISMVISYAFLIISIVSLVMINVRKDEKGIHDLLANTKVIYINKN